MPFAPIPITLEDGEGIITNLIDSDGEDTVNIFAAMVCVIEILTGPHAGMWATELVEDLNIEPITWH